MDVEFSFVCVCSQLRLCETLPDNYGVQFECFTFAHLIVRPLLLLATWGRMCRLFRPMGRNLIKFRAWPAFVWTACVVLISNRKAMTEKAALLSI